LIYSKRNVAESIETSLSQSLDLKLTVSLKMVKSTFVKKKALISVFDKSNLDALLPALEKDGYEFISTGGTAKYIKDQGYAVIEVSEFTSFPEMLGGRVKTLHPKVLAGILALRDQDTHMQELSTHHIEQIDLVVVNLYPFESVISKDDTSFENAIENIDIGGPTLLRSAAKNFKSITVLSNPSQYQEFTALLEENDKHKLLAFREKMSIEVFKLTNSYDAAIASYLNGKLLQTPIGASYKVGSETKTLPEAPETINLDLKLKQKLRYGENPHQWAGFYVPESQSLSGLATAKQLNGKEISFNNLLDLEAAWNIANEYDATIPCAAIIKHNNPCGVAIAPNAALAFSDALSCDTVSAFGGIVAVNVEVDEACAQEMLQIFLEVIIAPKFSPEALQLLKGKPNLRLLECDFVETNNFDIKRVSGGYLIQDFNSKLLEKEKLKTVTKTEVEESNWVDLILAWKIVKHVKSNAIVVVKDGKTIGIGCGQTNRVKSAADALAHCDFDTRGAVLASDGFLPFADNVDLAAQNHISTIIQPGGSIKDKEVIEACDKAGIAMVFTETRHFKH
jgi:phosphoribosylaminoimidazolecarboxamide formyltransferase/IMP cyclohydrolase